MRIGIMQGRLVPPEPGHFQAFPRERWTQEFDLAKQAGLESIEWIYDGYGADVNPIATDEGIQTLKDLSKQHGVAVVSLCADYFMEFPFIKASAAELPRLKAKLVWLLERCRKAGITRLVLPFVDASRIETPAHEDLVIGIMKELLPEAGRNAVEIHLETALDAEPFGALLDRLPSPWLKANYDSGNSAALGYVPADEFAAYGYRVGSVHIKDRIRGGRTAPLGSGNADFAGLFDALAELRYDGDFILQVAREEPGKEVAWAKKNIAFVNDWLSKSGLEDD